MVRSDFLVILGCSQRKRQTSRLIPAIERYDGPMFKVYRKHADERGDLVLFVLSARFGLIPGHRLIPRYERRLRASDRDDAQADVERDLQAVVDELRPSRLFASVGKSYWPLVRRPLDRRALGDKLTIASGSIGRRASQLVQWLQLVSHENLSLTDVPSSRPNGATECSQGCSAAEPLVASCPQFRPEGAEEATTPRTATLLGTTVTLSPAEVLAKARQALSDSPPAARRFETWYVLVDSDRVAPKWLVSVLLDKPVSRFRTADARRVLSILRVPCLFKE